MRFFPFSAPKNFTGKVIRQFDLFSHGYRSVSSVVSFSDIFSSFFFIANVTQLVFIIFYLKTGLLFINSSIYCRYRIVFSSSLFFITGRPARCAVLPLVSEWLYTTRHLYLSLLSDLLIVIFFYPHGHNQRWLLSGVVSVTNKETPTLLPYIYILDLMRHDDELIVADKKKKKKNKTETKNYGAINNKTNYTPWWSNICVSLWKSYMILTLRKSWEWVEIYNENLRLLLNIHFFLV